MLESVKGALKTGKDCLNKEMAPSPFLNEQKFFMALPLDVWNPESGASKTSMVAYPVGGFFCSFWEGFRKKDLGRNST